MNKPYEGHHESPYLAKLEADRQAQHWGYGVRKYHMSNGSVKWEAYSWERVTELMVTSVPISDLFDHQWEAERFLNFLKNR